jgi:hypothetical protein
LLFFGEMFTRGTYRYRSLPLLEKEMDLARVVQELAEVEAFITTVKTRKGELEAPE